MALNHSKILNWEDAEKTRENWKNETVVFTNGCFDILHAGHAAYLNEAKSLGNKLIIGLNSDRSVRELKGPSRPITRENERAYILASLEAVDMVVLFTERTPIELLKRLKPNLYVKGGDYTVDTLPETPVVTSWGGSVKILQFVPGLSTSNLIETIRRNPS